MPIPEIPLPESYAQLPTTQIRCSHVPESSKEVTPVIVITLYRPENHNAFTIHMMGELEKTINTLSVDPRVKCIVFTGHGRIFCAGADLSSSFKGGEENIRDHRDGGGRVALAIHRCQKPTIAAIQGSAVGIGITMTLPMTIRIAYEQAKIGFVFARRGLIMEAASSFFLPKLVGLSRALHLVTTGLTYRATDPLLSQLFSETHAQPEAILPRALELAQEIAQNTSTVSTQLMRELMYRGPETAEGTHLLDSRLIYAMFGSKDNKEGVDSFLAKRPAKFTAQMETDAPAAWPWWQPVDTGNRAVAENSNLKPKL